MVFGSSIAARLLVGILPWGIFPLAATAESGAAWELVVTDRDQMPLTRISLPAGGHWCLVWNHSVQGFAVIDCFRVTGERLTLDSSQTPDFAAGLGYIAGRGTLESDDRHGYRIVEMNVPIAQNTLRLRVGSESVNHRIRVDSHTVSLSQLAADQPVSIRLTPAGEQGTEVK